MKPTVRPQNPCFSSGPCAKRPGWSTAALESALVGRSHRSKPGKARIQEVLDRSRKLLGVPEDYRIGLMPASDTGAVEAALWSLLGPRGVDMLVWESFGQGWVTDVAKQLKLPDVRVLAADYGQISDLAQVDFSRDVVFTWNGTTSGVRVPNATWIPKEHDGLVICDATSAVFAMDVPVAKLDVVTYSWQKVLGGEGQHGMLILSPRAVERLESYVPSWPMPKIFRLTNNGKLIDGVFEGETINTPSMLCVEDYLDTLVWAKSAGGLEGLIARADANTKVIADWVARSPWIDFLAKDASIRSNTSVCLKVVDPAVVALPADAQAAFVKSLAAALEKEGVAYDIDAYRDAPPGLRVWCGATVEADDVEALTQWLDWAFTKTKDALPKAA
jgi:phosphoserine aminotransferase